MNKQGIKNLSSDSIPESNNFVDVKADSVVTVGTAQNGERVVTFIFLNNYPNVRNDNGTLIVDGIEKRKVASISLGNQQARKFYESLKGVFEKQES